MSLIDEALSANATIANDYDRSRRGPLQHLGWRQLRNLLWLAWRLDWLRAPATGLSMPRLRLAPGLAHASTAQSRGDTVAKPASVAALIRRSS